MSIADKLATITENIPKVYQAGYEKGAAEGGGSSDSWYDTFWDAYQENGERQSYSYAFYGPGWNDITFKPKYKFIAKARNSFNDMFRNNSGITEFNSADYFELPTNSPYTNYMFYGAEIKKVIFDLKGFASSGHMFRSSSVEWIELYNNSTKYDRTFENCASLKHLLIEGTGKAHTAFNVYKSPLDKESLISAFNYLSDSSSGLTATFNRAAVISAFNLEEDPDTGEFIPSEGLEEWNALIATKPNWTISLA